MIDTHAHIIKEYYEDIDSLVRDLQEKNVINVINCSTSIEDAKEIIELSKKTKNFLLPALGIHPEIVNDFDKVLDEFDQVIGLEYLKAIHINDSMNPCGAHKDRHEKIGEGHIGNDAFIKIVNNPRVQGLPFILETPNDDAGYAREIEMIKSWQK